MPDKKTTIIGLTGGIATGKSTVAGLFRRMGIPVICTDTIAHDLTKKGSPLLKEILNKFGSSIFNGDKTLNRPALAKIVFSSPREQKLLEKILHPRIKNEVLREIEKLKTKNHKLITIDVPLLFEAGWDKLCDRTVCVTAPQKLQIQRLKKYRKMPRRDALARIKAQMPLKEKAKQADCVIENNATLKNLRDQITRLIKKLRAQPDLNR